MDDERELLGEMLDGNEGAVRVFIDRYRFVVMGVFRRFRQFSKEDCEDLFSELFERLWTDDCRRLRRMYQDWRGGSLAGYIRHAARNLAVDRLRELGREPQPVPDPPPEPPPPLPDPDPVYLGQIRRMVGLAIEALGERCRKAFQLVHFEECTYAQAAQVMNMTSNAFGVALMRCRRQLLEIVERDYPALRLYFEEAFVRR